MSENNRDGLLDYSAMTNEQFEHHLQSIEAEMNLIKSEQENLRNANKEGKNIMELAKLKERRAKLNAIDYKSLDQSELTRYLRESSAVEALEMFAASSNQVKVEVPVDEGSLSPKNMRLTQLAAAETFKHLG